MDLRYNFEGNRNKPINLFPPTSGQTRSSRDLSLGLGLETPRDPFLQVLVSVLVLNLGVLVLVLEPSSLGLSLGLEIWDHGDSVFVTREA